jgi:hypothetical protein
MVEQLPIKGILCCLLFRSSISENKHMTIFGQYIVSYTFQKEYPIRRTCCEYPILPLLCLKILKALCTSYELYNCLTYMRTKSVNILQQVQTSASYFISFSLYEFFSCTVCIKTCFFILCSLNCLPRYLLLLLCRWMLSISVVYLAVSFHIILFFSLKEYMNIIIYTIRLVEFRSQFVWSLFFLQGKHFRSVILLSVWG